MTAAIDKALKREYEAYSGLNRPNEEGREAPDTLRSASRIPIRVPDLEGYEDILKVRSQYHKLSKRPAVLQVSLDNEHSCSIAIVGVLLNACRHFEGRALIDIKRCSEGLRYIISVSGHAHNFLIDGQPLNQSGNLTVAAPVE